MTFSLNEVEAQAKKAARGAGYSWGMAEEAGKATRWLCAQGVDGVATLAALLTDAPNAESCALRQGARLSDRAMLERSDSRALHRITQPILLMPFVASMARQKQMSQELRWDGGQAQTDGTRLWLSSDAPDHADSVTVNTCSISHPSRTPHSRAKPMPEAWRVLSEFAHRTYAPATEESRRLGAGDSQT